MTGELSLLLGRSAQAIRDDPKEARQRFKAAAKANDPNPACPNCGKRHRTITVDECADRQMSEAKLQSRVVYRARKYGWRVAHAGRGWVGGDEDVPGVVVTPMAKGWPDLSCFKAGHRAVYLELKREQGEVEPDQVEWLQLLASTGARVGIVRPSDLRLGRVEAIFRVGSPLPEGFV